MHAIVLTFLVGVLAVAASDGSYRSEQRPALRLVDAAPVTLRGSEFRAGENVRVTLTRQDRRFVRTARADGRGAFRVRFGLVAIDICRGAVRVTASGDRGSHATYRRACRPPHVRPPS